MGEILQLQLMFGHGLISEFFSFLNFPKIIVHLSINGALSKIQYLLLEILVKALVCHGQLVTQLTSAFFLHM